MILVDQKAQALLMYCNTSYLELQVYLLSILALLRFCYIIIYTSWSLGINNDVTESQRS